MEAEMEINYILKVNLEVVAYFRDYQLAVVNYNTFIRDVAPDGELPISLEDWEGRILFENKAATYCFAENQEATKNKRRI